MHKKADFVFKGKVKGGHGHQPPSPPPPPPPPIPTPLPGVTIGAVGGLQIDLQWDSSVASAPPGFEQAVMAAATLFTNQYPSKPVLVVIAVGYGEVNGTPLSSGNLGESETGGYLTDYATVANALHPAAAANAPTSAQFFVPNAQARLLGLKSATDTSVDGWVGLSSNYAFDYAGTGAGYDPIGIAAHEISEVMGRLSLQGEIINNTQTYTPLDLFAWASAGELKLSGGGGYFSLDGGVTSLAVFNAGSNGGDNGDWGSAPLGNDAFNAFSSMGTLIVSTYDFEEMTALGW